VFNQLVEEYSSDYPAAKQQGQSLEATLQNLDRFYEEEYWVTWVPVNGLAAWRRQLERLARSEPALGQHWHIFM